MRHDWMVRANNWYRAGGDLLIVLLVAFGAGVVVGLALMGAF